MLESDNKKLSSRSNAIDWNSLKNYLLAYSFFKHMLWGINLVWKDLHANGFGFLLKMGISYPIL